MEFKRLKYFIAVAEELHFGRAAARLGMAQPPLSRQIAALEDQLGVKLFDRSRNQVRLTDAGEVLLDRARDILTDLDSAYREATLIGKGGAGRLRIAFVGSATHGPLPTLIKSFRSHYPDVDLSLSSMNNAELERALIQRDIDIAVARPHLAAAEELRSARLFHEPLILALPDGSPHARTTSPIALRDLAAETFVLYPRRPRPSFADFILHVCAEEGFSPQEQVFAQDYQTAISLVSVGVGLAMVPESVSHSPRSGVTYRSYEGHNPGTSLTAHARLDNRKPQVVNFFTLLQQFTRRAS
ncbi:LysR substrate-binding domain-containing protein [Celeribacter neptunius]|uniref:DNA-binding transcriptional regulator, LysR family n=1 Tax=Celeribacter neptunius TaxID=588602 RepID=A0A1I3VNV5_9RHOB|nr:LysR substrate-binding domain-containing protein [Celeribacter neptunius]SFJ97058.1 DNA-binding transcriptional regulator, LysR family [Celeribacter neptunius]